MARRKRIRFPGKPSREQFDVAIVGGGVSGLGAASQIAKNSDWEVVILEKEVEPGGAPQHIDNYSFGWREYKRPMQGPTYAKKMLAGAKRSEILGGVQVTQLEPQWDDGAITHMLVHATGPQGAFTIQAKRVLLATGAWEASVHSRRIPGARPYGVMASGALLRHMQLTKVLPFQQPIIVGTEWVSMASIITLAKAGMKPPAIIDDWPQPATPGMVLKGLCKRYDIPFKPETRIERIIGRHKVEAVVLEHNGTRTMQVCDGVLLTGRFIPEIPYLHGSPFQLDPGSHGPATDQFHRCYIGDTPAPVYASGNILGIAKSSWVCSKQGEAAMNTIFKDMQEGLDAGPGLPIQHAPPIKYVWPQRHVFEDGDVPPKVYVDFHKPCSGVLCLRSSGRKVADRNITGIPGRLEALEPPPAMLPVLRKGTELTVTLEHPTDGPF